MHVGIRHNAQLGLSIGAWRACTCCVKASAMLALHTSLRLHPPHLTSCWGCVRAALLAPAGCVKFSLPASGGWEFKQGVDMPGYDVTNIPSAGGDWGKLIAGCDATPGCTCINTGGW